MRGLSGRHKLRRKRHVKRYDPNTWPSTLAMYRIVRAAERAERQAGKREAQQQVQEIEDP